MVKAASFRTLPLGAYMYFTLMTMPLSKGQCMPSAKGLRNWEIRMSINTHTRTSEEAYC